jgi:hypothetical protein
MTTDGIAARSGDMAVRDIAEILADSVMANAKANMPDSLNGV